MNLNKYKMVRPLNIVSKILGLSILISLITLFIINKCSPERVKSEVEVSYIDGYKDTITIETLGAPEILLRTDKGSYYMKTSGLINNVTPGVIRARLIKTNLK
jgi:hypothetical protein